MGRACKVPYFSPVSLICVFRSASSSFSESGFHVRGSFSDVLKHILYSMPVYFHFCIDPCILFGSP